jgi:hypothetical protein
MNIQKEHKQLYNAINRVPGVVAKSTSSLDHTTFFVRFIPESFEPLYILTRAMDRRYGGPDDYAGWSLQISDNDMIEDGHIARLSFWVMNESNGTNKVYDEANMIADNINQILDDKDLMKFIGY